MTLWEFLAKLFELFGVSITVDPWYYSAVQSIGFLPHDQIGSILSTYGHNVQDQVFCGVTFMQDDGRFNRTIPQVYIAQPSVVCPVNQLRFFVEHELRHVLHWIRDGLTIWSGH